jgi:two-component system, cell cycle sensor histidine kinase and response regulator CckA
MSTMARVMETKPSQKPNMQDQQLETLGLIASGIAHDFNNLLTSIIGQSSLALAVLPAENAARKHIEKAMKAAEFATALTRQLLDYASNNDSPSSLIILNHLIKDNVTILNMTLPDNIALKLELAPNLLPAVLKRTQIQQLLMNLIINSVESINDSGTIILRTGIHTFFSTNPGFPLINSCQLIPGDYVYLEVEDTGIGIENGTMTEMFKPFFTTKTDGRGLGLATILKTVKEHHGAITVKSQPDIGTKFTVFFPAFKNGLNLQ